MPTEKQVVVGGKSFHFDRAYWSHSPSDPHFAAQQILMDELGRDVLDNALEGFNSCLFAYGQTGAGKTHSVLGGEGEQRGLLPRILQALFEEIELGDGRAQCHCTVSYLEIYNEQLRDLLVPVEERSRAQLSIRNHPKLGVYVPGLTEGVVKQWSEVSKMIDFGQKTRSVAATSMNATSSRSHCIFTFFLEKETTTDNGRKESSRARVNLVDLAGSERQTKTRAEGARLKEGAMINQSLSSLAQVIHALALNNSGDRQEFVSFRNSKLTHLLQESLSGNSKTVMVAAISPAESNLEETLSTLRFAQTCKSVTTKAVKNQESTSNVIEELKAEIARLKELGGLATACDPELLQRLQESEALRAKLEEGRQTQLEDAKRREEERAKVLEDMGLSMEELSTSLGVDPDLPKLINLSEDPSLSGCLVYYLPKDQELLVGSSRKTCRIVLVGLGIEPHMCSLLNEENRRVALRLLSPEGAALDDGALRRLGRPRAQRGDSGPSCGRVLVNGRMPQEARVELRHTDRLILGHAFCFRLVIPLLSEAVASFGGGDASTKAVASESGQGVAGGGFEEALQEVVSMHADEFQECRALMDSIQDRIGEQKAHDFLDIFGRALPLVEEANLITSIVRRDAGLRFQLEVCSDIMHFTTDEPELIVRLYLERAGARGEVVVDVTEISSFVERLGHMREVYADHQARPEQSDFGQPGIDPWASSGYQELRQAALDSQRCHEAQAHRLCHLEAQLAQERLLRQRAENGAAAAGWPLGKGAAAVDVASAALTAERMASLENQLAASQASLAAQFDRAAALERRLAVAEAAGHMSSMSFVVDGTAPCVVGGGCGIEDELQRQLTRSKEETAATARMAAQLLESLRSIKAFKVSTA